jgi:4-hydroxybenzoate polyprenyltransferase
MLRPYIQLLRLHAPIGIWLLFFPAAWAVAMVGADAALGALMLMMLAGAFLTRAAGCIINDLTDRTLDAQVARTKDRPLASGAIAPRQALLVLALLLALALLIALQLPAQVLVLAVVALPLIVAYPWMKRLTWWPQLFLGITFNLAALAGWLAAGVPLVLPALLLYAACVVWTLGYDTVYALQDMADDEQAGIRSSARALGLGRVRGFVGACYLAMLLLLSATGYLLALGWPFYLGVLAAAAQAGWQIRQLPVGRASPSNVFRSNQWLGLFVLMGLLADRLL